MGILGRLLGTDKAIDNLLDKNEGLLVRGGRWIDGLHHSDQEKAEDNQLTRQWGIAQLQAIAPFKVVQRIIALSVMTFWILVGVNVLVAIWIEAITGIQVKEQMLAFAFSDFVFWPVLSVLSLYLSGGVIPHMFTNKGAK